MIFYIASTNKLLELINEFGKLSRYKNQLYFHRLAVNTSNKIKKTLHSQYHQKEKKYVKRKELERVEEERGQICWFEHNMDY